MTQEQLAEVFGIRMQAVSGWENDRSRPDPEKYPALVRALKITFPYLIEGGEMPDPEDLAVVIDSLPPAARAQAVRVVKALAEKPEAAA